MDPEEEESPLIDPSATKIKIRGDNDSDRKIETGQSAEEDSEDDSAKKDSQE